MVLFLDLIDQRSAPTTSNLQHWTSQLAVISRETSRRVVVSSRSSSKLLTRQPTFQLFRLTEINKFKSTINVVNDIVRLEVVVNNS